MTSESHQGLRPIPVVRTGSYPCTFTMTVLGSPYFIGEFLQEWFRLKGSRGMYLR